MIRTGDGFRKEMSCGHQGVPMESVDRKAKSHKWFTAWQEIEYYRMSRVVWLIFARSHRDKKVLNEGGEKLDVYLGVEHRRKI